MATAEVRRAAVSTFEAELAPTVAAARTAKPQSAATAIVDATFQAIVVTVELGIPPNRSLADIGSYNDPDLVLRYYEWMVLGLETGNTGRTRASLPADIQREVDSALLWATERYEKRFTEGRGVVGLIADDQVDDLGSAVNRASLGAYVWETQAALPTNADEARVALWSTYPGVSAEYGVLIEVDGGYAFESRSTLPAVVGGEAIIVPQMVRAGVSQGRDEGTIQVWVVVARGLMVPALDQARKGENSPDR